MALRGVTGLDAQVGSGGADRGRRKWGRRIFSINALLNNNMERKCVCLLYSFGSAANLSYRATHLLFMMLDNFIGTSLYLKSPRCPYASFPGASVPA